MKRGETGSVSIPVTKPLAVQQIVEAGLGEGQQAGQKEKKAFPSHDLLGPTLLPASGLLNDLSAVGWALKELRSRAPQRYEEISEVLPELSLSEAVVDRITRIFAHEKNVIVLYILLRQAAYRIKQRTTPGQFIIPANQYAQEVPRELGCDPDSIEQMTIAIELSGLLA